jgi:hypothetical protein
MIMRNALLAAGAVTVAHMVAEQGAGGSSDEANQPNSAHTKEAFLRSIRSFGANEGKGVNARPSMAIQIVEAAHLGTITEDDADQIFESYTKAAANAKGISTVKQGSQSQQVSKIRTFIKLGQLTSIDGRTTIAKVANAYKEQRDANGGKPLSKSAYDSLLAGARTQIDFPDEVLSDDMVLTCIHPEPKDEKDGGRPCRRHLRRDRAAGR